MASSAPSSTVLIAGATGLVGGLCLAHLDDNPAVERIVPVGRRAPERAGPKIEPLILELEKLSSADPIPARVALCALGTTIKKAGSEAAFRAVDLDAVVAFAKWAREGGAEVFGLVSSVGASAKASSFYMKVKGEAEVAVGAIGYPTFVALRPGMLLGDRSESRPGEAVGRAVMPALNPLLFGPVRRFRGIDANHVAAALASLVDLPASSSRAVWHYDEMTSAASRQVGAGI